MFHQPELSFLCEVFEKSHVGVTVIERSELLRLLDEQAPATVDLAYAQDMLRKAASTASERTLYRLVDPFTFTYRLLLLPSYENPTLLLLGPSRDASLTSEQLMELGERNGIPPKHQRHFDEYYQSIPCLPFDSPLWIMLHAFCERIWESPSFDVQEIRPTPAAEPHLFDPPPHRSQEDLLVSMRAMERRYAFENEMIRAVEQGQLHVQSRLLSDFPQDFLEKRAADPLRNAQNYAIIMNTLLRKAAERGGVHPVYLDRLSSAFALRIEALSTLQDNASLMQEMFRSYCLLVREHATRDLPPVVQNTLLLIDNDHTADLSLTTLAEAQGVSPGYLSTVFKKSTGETVSAYIRRRRMSYAAHLLTDTALQIQTVALHCGILDVQYFSKLFKQEYGMTPSAYRATRGGKDR